MKSEELKNKLLELFKDKNLTLNEIIQEFFEACKISKNNQWQKIKSKGRHMVYRDLEGESFRKLHGIKNSKQYCYWISNYGRIVVVDMHNLGPYNQNENISFKNYLSKDNCWLLPTEDGFISQECLSVTSDKEIKLATETDIYKFMAEANWIEPELSIHHINNDPDDNRVSNLIYLQKNIHNHVHPKQ